MNGPHRNDRPSAAAIEAAKQACAREREEAVEAIGGDVIGISEDGKLQRRADVDETRRPHTHAN